MSVTSIDRSIAHMIISELESAAKAIAAKHGLVVTPARARFSTANVSTGIELRVPAKSLEAYERLNFALYAARYGFAQTDYKRRFLFRGHYYELVSFNPSAPKFAVNARRLPDGKEFRFPTSVVRDLVKTP